MGRFLDRHLVLLAVAISLTLTVLTVTAVIQQGQTLRERELANLRESAERAASEKTSVFQAELRALFDAASEVWLRGGRDELDAWLVRQRDWPLGLHSDDGGPWVALPFTPLQTPLPDVRAADFAIGENLEFTNEDLIAAVERFERLADSGDELIRVRAMLAAAACRRKLGLHAVAARTFADAAAAMRAAPRLARYAPAADLAAVDSLLENGQAARAEEALTALLSGLREDHPGRLARAEVGLLRTRAARIGRGAPRIAHAAMLDALERNASARTTLLTKSGDVQRAFPSADDPSGDSVALLNTGGWGRRAVLVAARRVGENGRLALLAPLDDVLKRFWDSGGEDAAWRVALPTDEAAGDFEPLLRLGDAFGSATLVPTAATMERLAAQSRRRVALLVTTAGTTAGAWALVIWMMVRAVGRQRELVRLQQRFVADVSHELKTPLALIRLLAETLRDGRMRDPERIKGYHETITRESERLTVLLDNILDFSKIESGRKQYDIVDCDVADVARQAWALFEPQLAAEGFERQLQIGPELPRVKADPAALGQLIVNLLQNAFRYAGERKFVRLAVRREGAHVAILVDDLGIGMTRTQVQRLGSSFYRVPDPRVRKQRGTGLGLAIVSHIVGAHGGKMEVTSRPNQGSTFCVRLPIEPK